MIMDTTRPVEPSDEKGAAPLGYDGRFWAFLGLVTWTTLLLVPTLLIYRFWARTRIRRYLWSRVSLAGDRFDYTGTGGELFRGFLMAMLVVFVLLLPLQILEVLLIDDEGAILVLGAFKVVAISLAGAAGRYYARRYRLTRTRWRSVRGNLVGGLGRYLALTVGWGLLAAATVGLTYPLYRVALQRHLLRHTWFGDQRFTCSTSSGPLFLRWLPAWAGGVVIPLLLLAAAIALPTFFKQVGDLTPAVIGGMVITALLLLPLAVLLFAWYWVHEVRALAAGLRLGDVGFASRLTFRSILGLLLRYGALVFGLFAIPGVIGLMALVSAAGRGEGFMLLTGMLGFAAVVGWGILTPVFWQHGVLARLLPSLVVLGPFDPDRIAQNTGPVPARGEGLAELFDIAG
jgi:uncharacterized membrane protein YjgN (DUF898 family)